MKTATLKLACNLELPLDAVTQPIAVVAKTRAGKSYFARRFAEQLVHAGQQVVIVDPKGDWWGIRSAADGKSPGLPIVIIGGERGDVPLEASGGELVAKLVVEERVSALLDLSLLRKHEVATFMTAFLEALYRLKAREQYRTPMMLMMDEADAIAPQKPQPNEARMLGAAEDIVRRGGQRGLGTMFITQRTAVLNKNVLTQAQILIALRTIAPQDLKAMGAWVDVHGEEDQRSTLMASLPSLPVGDAWVWAPGWPKAEGLFERIHTLPIETYDSGATPKAGERRAEPKRMADVDMEALRRQMAETIDRAKADDPKALRARIAELEREVAERPAPAPERMLTPEDDRRLRELALALEHFQTAMEEANERWKLSNTLLDASRHLFPKLTCLPGGKLGLELAAAPAGRKEPEQYHRLDDSRVIHGKHIVPKVKAGTAGLTNSDKKVLTALAQYPKGRSKAQVAMLCGYSAGGGGFNNVLSSLRTRGFIEGSGDLAITAAGSTALGPFERLPTGKALHQHWLGQQTGAGRKVLEQLIAAYPRSLSKTHVASVTGYEPNGGGFNNALSRLRTLGLIVGKGELRAGEELFQ